MRVGEALAGRRRLRGASAGEREWRAGFERARGAGGRQGAGGGRDAYNGGTGDDERGQGERRVTDNVRRGIELALGFGMAKAVVSNAYITAFGDGARESMGFVSSTGFVLATNALCVLVALVAIAASLSERRPQLGRAARSGSLGMRSLRLGACLSSPLLAVACLASLALVVGYLLGATGALAALPPAASLAVRAVLYALGSVTLALVWFVPFARMAEVSLAVRCLITGYLVQAGVFFGLSFLAGWGRFFGTAAVLAASCVLLARTVRVWRAEALAAAARAESGTEAAGAGNAFGPSPLSQRERTRALRSALSSLYSSFACVFVLIAVVGLLHTSVIGSELEPVVEAVPMAETLVLATGIMALVMALRRHVPDTTLVYRVLFPVMLAALSLLPFVSDALGTLSGMVMVVCYDLVGIAFVLLLVEVAQARRDVPAVALAGVYQAGMQLSLLVGLLLGLAVDLLGTHASEASYVTILMLVCIYLLSMVLMVLLRRRGSGPATQAGTAGPAGVGMPADAGAQASAGVPAGVSAAGAAGGLAGAGGAAGTGGFAGGLSRPAGAMTHVRAGGAANADAGEPPAEEQPFFGEGRPAATASAGAGAGGLAGAGAGVGTGVGQAEAPDGRPTQGEILEQQSVREQVGARVERFALARGLTPRESQVLVQLARGRSAPALAADLGITENTAWAHIKRVYAKLGVHGKQELIDLVEREVISPANAAGATNGEGPDRQRI